MAKNTDFRRDISKYITEPVAKFLSKTPITPDFITWLGFLLAIAAAVLVARGDLLLGGMTILVASSMDMFDGALARYTNSVSKYGAVLDSTLDRAAEAALFVCCMIYFYNEASVAGVATTGIALGSSQIVSYLRAKAEATGMECKVGFFTRPERIVFMVLGLITGLLLAAVTIIAFFSIFTAVQRFTYISKNLK